MTVHYTQQEYGVRTVYVWGIPVSVSKTNGSLVLRAAPHYCGQTIQIIGKAYTPTNGITATRSFTHHHITGELFAVVSFHRLPPGNYYLSSSVPGHSFEEVTITSGWADRIDWSH